ncbi:MAG: NADH-quinone oxidoreductase subunit C, partial [Burkholderiales bacterium]
FEIVYHFYSLKHNSRLRIKAPVSENDCTIDSVSSLWKTANWYEREVWDLYGIKFNEHPDMRRILLYEEFKGHPLRKDYPINKRQPLIGPLN